MVLCVQVLHFWNTKFIEPLNQCLAGHEVHVQGAQFYKLMYNFMNYLMYVVYSIL